MQATILCGGRSTRLRPVWEGAKSCVPVNGRPFIHWQLDRLEQAGIRNVLLLTGHMRDDIVRAVERWRGDLGIDEQCNTEGSGCAVRAAAEKLQSPSLLLYAGIYPRGDVTKPLRDARNGRICFSVSRSTTGKGNVLLKSPPPSKVHEYGIQSQWLEAGCMAIHPQYFRKLSPMHRKRLEDWLHAFCAAGIVDCVEVPASLDVSTPDGLARCKSELSERRRA